MASLSFLHSGKSLPATSEDHSSWAAKDAEFNPLVWRLAERAGDEGCGKLLWGDLGEGKELARGNDC